MSPYYIRNAKPEEFKDAGKLMVEVYSQLEGFPKRDEQPKYYEMLENVGDLTRHPETELLVALNEEGKIAGAVVYYGDMRYYGSGGNAMKEEQAAGFRLLAVAEWARSSGLGKELAKKCISKARDKRKSKILIHTTKAMQRAWSMYEKMGFVRAEDLDFIQGQLPVFGFRMYL